MWRPVVHEFDNNLIYIRNNDLKVHFKKLEEIKKRKNTYFRISGDFDTSRHDLREFKEHLGQVSKNRGLSTNLNHSILKQQNSTLTLGDGNSNLSKFLRHSPLREQNYFVNRDNKHMYDKLYEINKKSFDNCNKILKTDVEAENDNKLKGLYFREQINKSKKKLSQQNLNLKKRLKEKSPNINFNKLDVEFLKTRKILHQLTRVKFNSELGNTYSIPTKINSSANSVHSLRTAPNQSNFITLTSPSTFNSTFKNRTTSKSMKLKSTTFSSGEKKLKRKLIDNHDVHNITTNLNFKNYNKMNLSQKSLKTQELSNLPNINTNSKLLTD